MANDVIIISQPVEPNVLVMYEGPQGPQGDPGPKGDIGPQGDKGDKGDAGPSALGTKTTLYELYGSNVGGAAVDGSDAIHTKLLTQAGQGVFLTTESVNRIVFTCLGKNRSTGSFCTSYRPTLSFYIEIGSDFHSAVFHDEGSAQYSPTGLICSDANIAVNMPTDSGGNNSPLLDATTGELSFSFGAFNFSTPDSASGSFDWYVKVEVMTFK
jgi:hypothetical protein